MGAAGAFPANDRDIAVALPSDFVTAFISLTNPIFAFAGHCKFAHFFFPPFPYYRTFPIFWHLLTCRSFLMKVMFFILVSEMRKPQDAMKAAYTLQSFATTFYTVFAIVTYYYLGPGVSSPSFSSLPVTWQKVTYGIALPNFLIAGCLYSHTAAKLLFVRIFRRSRHLYSHTVLGWTTWTMLVFATVAVAFLLAVGVPIFNYLIGLAAALFASWYTYGLAGAFWIYDTAIGWVKLLVLYPTCSIR